MEHKFVGTEEHGTEETLDALGSGGVVSGRDARKQSEVLDYEGYQHYLM